MLVFIGILFIFLLLIGIPIAFVVGIISLIAFLLLGQPLLLSVVAQRMFTGLDMFTIMAIPFFFLAAEVMKESKMTQDIVDFVDACVGSIRGGLAHVNIVASVFFAGITGSAISDVAALGSILIPTMEEAGYGKKFATAITVSSSIIGPIIPPSIMMVLYGAIMQVSIAGLFLGGLIPGFIFAIMLMILVYFFSVTGRYEIPEPKKSFSLKIFLNEFKKGTLALAMPAIILGGILSGVFTPTEAAAVASIYAFIVGFLIKRTFKIKNVPEIFKKVSINTSIVFMVLATASIFSWYLGLERIPQMIADAFIQLSENPYIILFLINILLIIVGMFMDIGAAVIVMAPIFAPTVVSLGVHPLHFGIVMVINLLIGLTTPPVGPCIFAASGITGLKIEDISIALIPFYIVQLALLFVITYIPALTLFLPRFFGYI